MPGPAPKRSEERRRRNLDGRPDKIEAEGGPVRVPSLPRGIHPLARGVYTALKESGQSQYFEPSDWAAALVLVSHYSDLLKSGKTITANQFEAIWGGLQDLLMTESARRRVRLEVERVQKQEATPPGVAAITDYFDRKDA